MFPCSLVRSVLSNISLEIKVPDTLQSSVGSEVGDPGAFAAEAKDEGASDLHHLSAGLDSGHFSSIHVDSKQLQDVSMTPSLSFHSFFLDLIRLPIQSKVMLPDLSVVGTPFGTR